MKIAILFSALSILGPAASAQTAAEALSRIGAAGAVHGKVQAVAPNTRVGRIVESGKPLYLNDHVTTDAAGRLQVLLLDETVFTLGPDADIVLDEFVYDPKTSAGKVSAQVVKGAFRFVTGKVGRSRPESMKVGLAVGSIGIRGTVVVGETGKDGSTVINAGAGPDNNADERPSAIIVENSGVKRPVILTGQGVTVKPGQAPSFPHDMAQELARISALLTLPPKNQPQPNEPGGGASATDRSGELVAALRDLAVDANGDQNATQSSSQQSNLVAQHGGALPYQDGPTTWDFINLQNPGGQAMYFSGEAPATCTGPCASGANVAASLQLQINFAARTVGGAGGIFNPTSGQSGSFIHVHGVALAGQSDTIQQIIGIGTNNQSPISFASLTGPATITLNNTNLGPVTTTSGGTGNFSGSTISLQNASGTVAKQAVTNIVFSGQNTLTQSVSVSGTFSSPR